MPPRIHRLRPTPGTPAQSPSAAAPPRRPHPAVARSPRPIAGPRLTGVLVVLSLLLPASATEARAQGWDAAAGATLGAGGGAVVSMGLLAAGARLGHYVFSPDPLRWQALPIPLGALAGGVLGHRNRDRLWRGVGWGAGGLLAGAVAGAAAGHLLWGSDGGAWSGGLVGGAAGLLAGTLAGVLTWEGGAHAPARVELSIPLGLPPP
jgi:hypothetical protein